MAIATFEALTLPMSDQAPRFWFRAKRYGWGWGLPATWQGWVVFAGWIGAIVVASVLTLTPTPRWGLYAVSLTVLTLLLVAICWLKGEPPRWRWGN